MIANQDRMQVAEPSGNGKKRHHISKSKIRNPCPPLLSLRRGRRAKSRDNPQSAPSMPPDA